MVFQNSFTSNKVEIKELLGFCLLHISEKESSKLIFEENFKLVNDDGDIVDEVTTSVEPGESGFEVFDYSQDENHKLRVRSHVSRTLETLSEVRKIKQNKIEILLRITNLPDVYRVFLVKTDLDQWKGSRSTTDFRKSQCTPLILEGANILLLRKLAMIHHFGEFKAYTINNDGELCQAHYLVDFLSVDEVMVTRIVGSETMTTVLSHQGRILHHKWSNSQWRLELRMTRLREKGRPSELGLGDAQVGQQEEEEPLAAVDLPAYWKRKEEVMALLQQYIVHSSDVEDMIADLMKNILFEKPDDPIDFADKFLSEILGISREFDIESDTVFTPSPIISNLSNESTTTN